VSTHELGTTSNKPQVGRIPTQPKRQLVTKCHGAIDSLQSPDTYPSNSKIDGFVDGCLLLRAHGE